MKPIASEKAFTQNWIQSLTLVSQDPVARSIKPLLDRISRLCGANVEVELEDAATQVWEHCNSHSATDLLAIMPVQQTDWVFDRDDPFVYSRTSRDQVDSFTSWRQMLGIDEYDVPLNAAVTSKDWLNLVRQEAVRQQRSMNTSSVAGAAMNLQVPCKARWEKSGWAVRFDQADWIVNRYEDAVNVSRPEFSEYEETVLWNVASSQEKLVPKNLPKVDLEMEVGSWVGCVPALETFHRKVLAEANKPSSAWFRRAWSCAWPVVYREQNALKGRADIDVIRKELAACVSQVPKLTVHLFVLAKLVCESQLGRGLGVSADYSV